MIEKVTRVVREADEAFKTVGGSTRHWVRDCLLPALDRAGIELFERNPTAESPAPDLDLDLLRKMLEGGPGGRRTGALKRAGLLEFHVTEAGLAALRKEGA